jgi:hypothetical protein
MAETAKARLIDLEERVTALEQEDSTPFAPAATGIPEETLEEIILALTEALRCANINTAARMAEELEEKYFGDTMDKDDGPLMRRFPWMVDYR